MSIINPGQNNRQLTVMYQNVQGLIPFKDLGHKNPSLNITKVNELQSHIYKEEYDIIILNETWLTKNIHSNEILSSNGYNIFREDGSSSSTTQPMDPEIIQNIGKMVGES